MTIIGYYDGSVVKVDKPLKKEQRVLVIPVEDEELLSAAGALQKYADKQKAAKEKDAWKKAVTEKYGK